jgi:cholesterol oxidase
MATFDAIVVGSGFGGAVTAGRLASTGYKVLVLERGRRWTVDTFPRAANDPWIWDQRQPLRCNGWFDFRIFPHMTVVQGAGVGGGSLVYANISVDAKPDTFNAGWPPEITFRELEPHYKAVGAMLDLQKVPGYLWPKRTSLLQEAAQKSGLGDRFRRLDLAVTFDPQWTYNLHDPHSYSHSKEFVNAQGQQQGTCVHLGECDIGCKVRARNTLDLNYLALAEKHGAEVRPLHLVRNLEPHDGGYRVHFERIEKTALVPGSETARLVVLAAGSLGSTELLLRCRDRHKTLTDLSPFLGRHWSSNGDFLTPAFHPMRQVDPTRGPTITAAIDLLDGKVAPNGQAVFIEDGGLPDIAKGYLQDLAANESEEVRKRALIESVRLLTRLNAFDRVMPWFAQACDAGDGVMSLVDGELFLNWDIEKSEKTINAVVAMHERLAKATGGIPLVPASWTFAKDLITPHPLGGANMGTTRDNGVVDYKGEVFGYRNLFVADGAIIPEALGLNPSKTIAALAEHIAAQIIAENR